MELPRNWNLIAAAICIAFVALALTFGMSEWKTIDTATAKAPAPATTTVH